MAKVGEKAEVLLPRTKRTNRRQRRIGGTKPGMMSGVIQMKSSSLMVMGIQATIGTSMRGMREPSPWSSLSPRQNNEREKNTKEKLSGKSKAKANKAAKSKSEKPARNTKTKPETHEGPSKVKKAKTNAMPSAGSTSKKRKPACEKDADQSSEPAKKKKAKTAKTASAEKEGSKPLITHGGKADIMAIRKFYKQYKDDDSTKASKEMKDLLKGSLGVGHLTECRLNIYWQTPACGVTSKTHSKDIAHFNFNQDVHGENYMTKLAIALKCAAMFVPWAQETMPNHRNCIGGFIFGMMFF